MFFWLTSLATSVLFAGVLGYLAFTQDNLDPFFKVSMLFTCYFIVQLLPYVSEIRQKAPFIFNVLAVLLFSWTYMIIPGYIVESYKYLISAIGPLYIIVEAAQSVGLSIVIGEKVADYLSGVGDDFSRNYNQDRNAYSYRCYCREQFALSMVALIYSLSFFILYQVFMMESTNTWPISVHWVIVLILIGMLIIFIVGIRCESGTIVQTALISLFLSYVLYSASQIQNEVIFSTTNFFQLNKNYLLQCAVVLFILLSIPPTMHDLDEIEINKVRGSYESREDYLKNEDETKLGSIFGKSTRLQSLIMAILILLLTHIGQIWMDRSLSLGLFWYRMAELGLSILMYLYIMFKENYYSTNDDDDDQYL